MCDEIPVGLLCLASFALGAAIALLASGSLTKRVQSDPPRTDAIVVDRRYVKDVLALNPNLVSAAEFSRLLDALGADAAHLLRQYESTVAHYAIRDDELTVLFTTPR